MPRIKIPLWIRYISRRVGDNMIWQFLGSFFTTLPPNGKAMFVPKAINVLTFNIKSADGGVKCFCLRVPRRGGGEVALI